MKYADYPGNLPGIRGASSAVPVMQSVRERGLRARQRQTSPRLAVRQRLLPVACAQAEQECLRGIAPQQVHSLQVERVFRCVEVCSVAAGPELGELYLEPSEELLAFFGRWLVRQH